MKCHNCGAILPDNSNARFCRNCGAELHPNTPDPLPTISAEDTQQTSSVKNEYYSQVDASGKKRNYALVASLALCAVLIVAVVVLYSSGSRTPANSSTPSTTVDADNLVDDTEEEVLFEDDDFESALSFDDINIANLTNGGHMASDGDGNLYYANPIDGTEWDTKSIVECSMSGSSKSTLYTAPSSTSNVYHINAIDGKVIFNQVIEKNQSTVVGVDVSTGHSYTIDFCDDWSLCQVVDDEVYYLLQGTIWQCDLEGRHKARMVSVGEKTKWRILNDSLYTFESEDAEAIYVSDLNGKNTKAIYQESDGYTVTNAIPVMMNDDSTALVVLEEAKGKDDLVRLVLENGNVRSIASAADIDRICVYEDGVILTKIKSSGRYTIGAIAYSGATTCADTEVPYSGEVRFTSYMGDIILFGTIDNNDCSVHSFEMSSGTFNTITD